MYYRQYLDRSNRMPDSSSGLERARRERWPVPSVFLGTTFTGQPYGNATYALVSVDLPIFDRDVLVPPLPDLKQMAEDAYRFGKTGLLELLDSSRSNTEIKLNHVELVPRLRPNLTL